MTNKPVLDFSLSYFSALPALNCNHHRTTSGLVSLAFAVSSFIMTEKILPCRIYRSQGDLNAGSLDPIQAHIRFLPQNVDSFFKADILDSSTGSMQTSKRDSSIMIWSASGISHSEDSLPPAILIWQTVRLISSGDRTCSWRECCKSNLGTHPVIQLSRGNITVILDGKQDIVSHG